MMISTQKIALVIGGSRGLVAFNIALGRGGEADDIGGVVA
jgi:hypothetical protein